jgi:DNA-binding NtrC family response regulator/predicted hydrocarbon binding protein
VRVDDLDHKELLELDPDRGVIRFAGRRAVLWDAVGLGLMRKHLVGSIGLTAARALITQVGFAQGWRLAEALEGEFKWDSDEDRRSGGTRLLALEGLFRVAGEGGGGPLSREGVVLESSCEAEQHLQHLGRSEAAVCWAVCGLSSGYVSRTEGRRIYVLESRCLGKGDAACHLHGRTPEEWGEERAEELRYFEPGRLEDSFDASLQQVTETLKAAERKLRKHRRALVQAGHDAEEPLGIVARSNTMRKLVELARRVARVDSTVLVTGESGSGKERIARFIHDESTRAAGPFVAVNCGAITETLLESELFGHARGAFTGAMQDRPGLFEAANGGTLLLDEVGEVSPGMQVKLLRALQEREIRRVGENRSRAVDVRVLAATNRDLSSEVGKGAFRQDLYYRLKVVELPVPALRERRDDILPLARVLLAAAALRMKSRVAGLSPSTADQLLRYDWPGNVRELENAMERAVALARGSRVELDDLPEEVRSAAPLPAAATAGSVRPLDDVEKEYILAALERNGGNQTRTAKQLRIGAATLYRKLKSYGLIGGRAPSGAGQTKS